MVATQGIHPGRKSNYKECTTKEQGWWRVKPTHVTSQNKARKANLHLCEFGVKAISNNGEAPKARAISLVVWAFQQHIVVLMSHAVFQVKIWIPRCTHRCVTSPRPGTSETCSTDIYSCFSYGSGSSGHTCRKWALTWSSFEKSPAGDRKKKPMGKDAGNCQDHPDPSPPIQSTRGGFPKEAALSILPAPVLL